MQKMFVNILYISVVTMVVCFLCVSPVISTTDLIDIPTAEVVDYYAMALNFRLYSEGGIISRLTFGVFKQLNIGASWDVDKLIGIKNPEPLQPTLHLKFRLYDGSKNMPAFAIGYDGQGYNYNESTGKYIHREKGIYLVGSTELLLKNFWFHFGTNMNFAKENNKQEAHGYGFFGVDYSILDDEKKMVSFLVEYDNLFIDTPENRLNSAIRFFPAQGLYIDFAFRDIASPKKYDTERFLKINYQTKF